MLKIKILRHHLNLISWVLLGVLFFALSFPGLLNRDGLPFFAFIAFYPLYHIALRANYGEGIFYGFIYGTGSYLLFNYWLKEFDPVSFSIAPTILGFYYILLFILIIFIKNNFKRFLYIPLTLAFLAHEIFKGENIIGYTYGTLAHSMYKTHLFTGILDITGTYVLSLLIIFPSIFLAVYFFKRESISIKELKKVIIIYSLIMLTSIFYTFINKVDYSDSPTLKTALIQHNLDGWAKGSNQLYKDTLDILLDLTSESQKEEPELVIWSETAFIPAIEWHKKYKTSFFRLSLVNRMEEYFKETNSDFIIGSNETIGDNDEDQTFYNSAYLYKKGEIVNKYRKIILVPFTERFPFENHLKWLKDYVKSIGGKDLTPGEKQINFETNGFNAVPLICYEDTFSEVASEGVRNGGDFILNMTNDAWSKELACSKQHYASAVFRSIENRRSFVRVGTGGYSTVVDPNGKMLTSLPILQEAQTTYNIPIFQPEGLTFYTKYGPIVQNLLLILFGIIILTQIIRSTLSLLQVKKKVDQD